MTSFCRHQLTDVKVNDAARFVNFSADKLESVRR